MTKPVSTINWTTGALPSGRIDVEAREDEKLVEVTVQPPAERPAGPPMYLEASDALALAEVLEIAARLAMRANMAEHDQVRGLPVTS